MLVRLFLLSMFGVLSSTLVAQENIDQWLDQYDNGGQDKRIEAVLKVGELLPAADEVDADRAYDFMFRAIGDSSELVRSASKLRLAEMSAQAVPYLRKYAESDKLGEFSLACEIIKTLGADAKVYLPNIVKQLDNKEDRFHLAALHAMRVFPAEDLLPHLDKVISELDSKNFNIQLSACRVIVQIGEPAKKAGPRLVKLLEEGIVSSRSWASIALGAIGPHEDYDVVDLLKQRLSRFYLVDRERALVGLAYLGPKAKSALPDVEKLMNSPEKSCQPTAARTYWKITGQVDKPVQALIPLLPTMEHGVDAMDVITEMESAAKAAVPALIKQTKSSEAPSRESAVYALAAIGAEAKSSIPDLERVQTRDPDRLIREAAKFAIQTINDAEAKAKETESGTEKSDAKAADTEKSDAKQEKSGDGSG